VIKKYLAEKNDQKNSLKKWSICRYFGEFIYKKKHFAEKSDQKIFR
jgi:hypothetical protein